MTDRIKSRLLQYAMIGFASAVGLIVVTGLMGWAIEAELHPFMVPLSIACMGCGMAAGTIERRLKG